MSENSDELLTKAIEFVNKNLKKGVEPFHTDMVLTGQKEKSGRRNAVAETNDVTRNIIAYYMDSIKKDQTILGFLMQ